MSQIIFDLGSGNTCKNDPKIIKQMLWGISDRDTGRHEIIIKWQLFKNAPPNIPLTKDAFEFAYTFAEHLGYKTTSSVFDLESLHYLMGFNVPFVKIACRPELYELAKYSTVPVYISTSQSGLDLSGAVKLACIPKYPATIAEYENTFGISELQYISDHTPGWSLYERHKPLILEKHYVHERSEDNPDAGIFAVTPDQLEGVI